MLRQPVSVNRLNLEAPTCSEMINFLIMALSIELLARTSRSNSLLFPNVCDLPVFMGDLLRSPASNYFYGPIVSPENAQKWGVAH